MLSRVLCRLFGHEWTFFYRKDPGIVWGFCTRCELWKQG
jgi:hypothetical protein